MKIFLKTYTPVHIGTGEALHALDYVIHENNFYRVSQTQFINFLSQLPDAEEKINFFVDWVDQITRQLEEHQHTKSKVGTKDFNQTQRDLKAQLTLLQFCERAQIQQKFIEFLKKPENKIRKYQYRVSQQSKQQIRGLITTAANDLYLPGSSIKGALRTALIYQVLKNDRSGTHKTALIKDIHQCLADRTMKPKDLRKKIGRKMEYSVAFCGSYNRRKEITFEDEKMDLFKFLEVSDAVYVRGENPVEVLASDLYLATKLAPGRNYSNSRGTPIVATKQPQAPGLEAIRTGVVFQSEISIRLDLMYQVFQKIKDQKPQKEWISMEEKVAALYGISLPEVTIDNLNVLQKQAEAYLQQAITWFSTDLARFDHTWMNEQMLPKSFDRFMPEKSVFKLPFERLRTFQHNGTTLLRTGFASGFAGTTEMLYLIEDNDLRTAFLKVMKKLELGKRPGVRDAKPFEPKIETFPKSRLLITYPDRSVSPLGWLEWIPEAYYRPEEKQEMTAATGSDNIEPPAQAPTPVTPSFFNKKLKQGEIVDAILIESKGKVKTFRLFIAEDNQPELNLNYNAPLDENKVYRIRISSIQKEKIQSIAFAGIKS